MFDGECNFVVLIYLIFLRKYGCACSSFCVCVWYLAIHITWKWERFTLHCNETDIRWSLYGFWLLDVHWGLYMVHYRWQSRTTLHTPFHLFCPVLMFSPYVSLCSFIYEVLLLFVLQLVYSIIYCSSLTWIWPDSSFGKLFAVSDCSGLGNQQLQVCRRRGLVAWQEWIDDVATNSLLPVHSSLHHDLIGSLVSQFTTLRPDSQHQRIFVALSFVLDYKKVTFTNPSCA